MASISGRGFSTLKILSTTLTTNQVRINNTTSLLKMVKQSYDCFLVLDFEATCKEGPLRISNPEIIEFPVLKVDGNTFDITDKFHEYVKPILNPELTDFCTKLTGITQEMVNSSEEFGTVFGNFQKWLEENLRPDERFLLVTCGDWDLNEMLPRQCDRENIVMPAYFKTFMNVKKAYCHTTGTFTKGMMPMLRDLNLKHEGKQHSGIDDCKNIANILRALSRNCVFRPTAGDRRHLTPYRPESHCEAACSSASNATPSYAGYADEKSKASLYPSLSLYEPSNEENNSKLYEPYDHMDGDRTKSIECDEKSDSVNNECVPDRIPDITPGQIPDRLDFPTIIIKLKERMTCKPFKTRDQEELQALCAAGKYLELMDEEDRQLVQSRLRYFYIALVYGFKIATKDLEMLPTTSVGISLPPELIGSRHHRDHKSHKDHHHRDRGSRRKYKHENSMEH